MNTQHNHVYARQQLEMSFSDEDFYTQNLEPEVHQVVKELVGDQDLGDHGMEYEHPMIGYYGC